MKHYLRGQLAKAARLNKETLRYYENNGLIPPAQRDSNGYRYYPAETLVLLEFISVAKAAGFTLKEPFIYCNKLINSLEPFLLAIFKKIFVVPSSRCNPVISSHHHAYYFPFPY
ncbi:MerR family transcriptional regulator [Enterocloster lavalensis]|uniref:MerR family transcriptional regulator n=1 Tax=Enterocloster lavalensis TaxID=460384 RepID=UPI002FD8A47D